MSLNCKLDRNITLSQPSEGGGTDYCNGQDISMGVGGISSPILVYNISDVPSLTFEGDNRSDYSLYVDTINSTGKFYKIGHTDATYNEEYDNHKWTHSLSISVANIQPLFEDILSDAVNGKYIVCFRPNGAEDYRMFGWKFGATLDYSLNIQSDSLGYTITFEDTSEYPLFTVARDNFGSKDKVYTPIFVPLYDVYYCEQDQEAHHTGYIIAMYVVKVNAAGQPLGSDNKLCQWTGKKQDAYKINTIQSDGGYNIIGTYASTAVFDGKPVKILDYEKCPANVTNSIFINSKKAETISLNSTISAGTFTITSTDDWMMVTDPQYVTITPVEGANGSTPCALHHNGVGGCEQIKFMNKVTSEIVTLDVCVNLITVGSQYVFKCGTNEIVITPTVEGCSSAYTYTISPSPQSHSKDENGFIHIVPIEGQDVEYTLTLTHSCDSNEKKVVKVYVVCGNDNPIWQLQSSYCEIVDGEYTHYRINTYIDINPISETFSTIKEEIVYDGDCSEGEEEWELVGEFCEIVNGINTGYIIRRYINVNTTSPTYGQTKEEKTLDKTTCPEASPNPNWQIDGTFDPYCEQIYYEPSHTEGNSGRLIVMLRDGNRNSPTYNQTIESALTESDWTDLLQQLYGDFPCETPSTEPDVEEITSYCELEEDGSGNIHMTGYAIKTGIDKNVYSPTFLQSVTVRELDEECGGSPCNCSKLVTSDEPQPEECTCDDLTTVDEPPVPTNYKWLATYGDGRTQSTDCNLSNTTIAQGDVYLESLISVEIGECVTTIGQNAFNDSESLTSVTIPNNVTTIGRNAFLYCDSLPTTNNIRYADTYVVKATDNTLATYTLKSGTRFIGSSAFYGCTSLTSITIPNSVILISNGAFSGCTSLTSLTIPNSVTHIDASAFRSCTSLGSITIPESVVYIGSYAFYGCTGLESITCLATTPPTLDGTSVFGSTNNCPIYVPSQSVNAYKAAEGWSSFASRIQAID